MTRIEDHIAEEAQLLAEEKWLIEALQKIKRQRNCLQIERLQLESRLAKARLKNKRIGQTTGKTDEPHKPQFTSTVQSTVATPRRTRDSIEFEEPIAEEVIDAVQNLDFDACNDEELDLAVSKSVFSHELKKNVQEEYEEDDDDDGGDTLIDMNMFMNSKRSNGSIR
ncbi:hypothetical protein O0L34_g9807 [Tuta absoluta]|nr:hypothetical protein O0L34_g9807 [Tuta absoluta]